MREGLVTLQYLRTYLRSAYVLFLICYSSSDWRLAMKALYIFICGVVIIIIIFTHQIFITQEGLIKLLISLHNDQQQLIYQFQEQSFFIKIKYQISLSSKLLMQSSDENRKVYDSIYNFISFPKEIWQFIDTPQFQRLRNIKQLGCLSWVFPGAVHTRFEHSLGTGHLAQLYIKSLINKHNEKNRKINEEVYHEYYEERDHPYRSNIDTAIFTVTLAGILHDVGHGPFSHLFDSQVIDKLDGKKWQHQIASIHLIESIYDQILKNKTNKEEIDWLLKSKNRVQALMMGKIQKLQYVFHNDGTVSKGQQVQFSHLSNQFKSEFKKQIKTRPWQFEIISNRLTGIDVDKLDYFRRDAYYVGGKNIYIDHQLLISETLVLKQDHITEEDSWQLKSEKHRLCYPSKYADKVYDVFYSRYKLYKTFYLSLKSKGVDFMISQILQNVKEYFHLQQACRQLKNENKFQKYIRLTDSILERIQDAYDELISKIPENQRNSQDKYNDLIHKIPVSERKPHYEGLIKAGEILKMLKRREIFEFVKEYHKSYSDICAYEAVKKKIKEQLIKPQLYKDQGIILHMAEIGYGMQDRNPFQECKFYDKSLKEKKILTSNKNLFTMLKPEGLVEISLRIYYNQRLKNPTSQKIKQIQDLEKIIFKLATKIDSFDPGHSGTFTVRNQALQNTELETVIRDREVDDLIEKI